MRSLRVAAATAVATAAAAVTFAGGDARADVLKATLGQPLREVSHSVDVTVADGIATYKVRRVFANPGEVADEAGLAIDLPFGAAATGLRIRARDRWYDAELMEREKAAKLYQELTGHGAFAPKDPALLQWLWADKLYLQVFPVLPGAASTVEYTLTVPTRYQGGKIFLSYPRLKAAADPGAATDADAPPADSRPLAAPVITIHPSWGDATTRIVVDGLRVTPGAPVVLDAPVTPSWYAAVGGTADASYVASTLVVADSPAVKQKTFANATVVLDISHTYRSDLRVDLVTPRGERCAVFDGAGGGENDVKGKFPIHLPAGTPAVGTWQLVVSDHAALDVGTINAWSLELGEKAAKVELRASDLPVFIPDAPESETEAGVASIEIAPPKIDVMAARLGKVVASPQHGFARLELDLAPELKPLPAGARVVFVVDGSYSIGARGIDVQLAMIRGYLAHVPDATAEIVVYRRTASRLFGSFVAAPDVPGKLAAAKAAGKLDPGNGSALDQGAALATSILAAGAGAKTPLRVVITTDELLRTSFTPALAIAALAKLPPAAIVHVVQPDSGNDEELALLRDDQDTFSPIASAHHGIFARFDGMSGKPDKEIAGRALALVRPMQLDYAKVDGVEVEVDSLVLDGGADDVMREGQGVRQVQATATPPQSVTISGKIWGDPFRRVVAVDAGFARAAAGWVFSEDDYHDLSDAEQMKVAMTGRAVSPVTSYLAVEPGTRPSTAGIPIELRGSMGHGSGMGEGMGMGGMRGRVPPDLMALAAAGAQRCVAQLKPPTGWQVSISVETTRDEVVDVAIAAGAEQPIAKCLVEAVWAVRLTAEFDAEHDSFELDFH